LQAAYPDQKWAPYNRFRFGKTTDLAGSKSQTSMFNNLKSLLPDTTILQNFRYTFDAKETPNGLRFYEFDVS
jgi:hypothetical protein